MKLEYTPMTIIGIILTWFSWVLPNLNHVPRIASPIVFIIGIIFFFVGIFSLVGVERRNGL